MLNAHNYVALPGNSTNNPIHILNTFLEDAKSTDKEIWVLSQDMSKAYDSVNINLLTKALQRLNMPYQLVNILTNLLHNRTNQIITNLGLTLSYNVQDGIDQGETITPLLWRIYYDPLISTIHTKYTGYTTSTKWITHINPNRYQSTTASTSVLAYMDDTLWLAKSAEQLQKITNTAASFYTMAHIKVNLHKSILTSNTKLNTSINFIN